MAAAKKPATTKAVANWDERLAGYATEVAATEQGGGGGKFISTKSGQLSYGGNVMPENKMTVVVLDHIMENHRYTERFNSEQPTSPVCFAFGRSEDTMVPHENSTEPGCDQCKGCPLNEWGSADVGKGKACKNTRRLAVLTEDGLEDIENAEVAYLKIPVTSVKNWSGYVQAVANNLKRPPFGVVTEVSLVPDPNTQFRMQFKLVEAIEDSEALEALIARRALVANEIDFPYQPFEEAVAPTRKPGKFAAAAAPKPAAKPAARR